MPAQLFCFLRLPMKNFVERSLEAVLLITYHVTIQLGTETIKMEEHAFIFVTTSMNALVYYSFFYLNNSKGRFYMVKISRISHNISNTLILLVASTHVM